MSSRVNPDFQLSRNDYKAKFEGHLNLPQSMDAQYFNGNVTDFDFILIGNSHARHFFSYIKKHGIKVASLALDGCTSTKNYYSFYNKKKCESRYKMELDFINAHPEKPVIISRNWPGLQYEDIKREDGSHIGKADYNKLMVEEMTSFYNDANHGQNFYIIGSTPRSSSVMFECLAKADLPINKLINIFDCSNTRQRVNTAADEALKNFAGKYAKVKFIDTYPFLCNHTECTLIKDGIPIYTDTSHLSITGAEIVGKGVFNGIRRDTNLHK